MTENKNSIINSDNNDTDQKFNSFTDYMLYKAKIRTNQLAKQLMAKGFDAMTIFPDFDRLEWLMWSSAKRITKKHLGKAYRKLTKTEKEMFFEYWKNVQIAIENGLLAGRWDPRKARYYL